MDEPAFIHPTAQIQGKVYLGPGVSVWTYAVTRSEIYEIRIGAGTNIQDFVMIHEGSGYPTIVGENCSINHRVTLHGCEIGDICLIGIGATIMDGAKIGANSIVAGNAIVTEGSEFPENSVIGGVPAKLLTTRNNREANIANAGFYQAAAGQYAKGEERLTTEDQAKFSAQHQEG